MHIQEALKYGFEVLKKSSDSPMLDAEILLSFVLKKDRVFLFTHPEKKLTKKEWQKYKKLVKRRVAHEPIAYLTHHREFYGLDFYVDRRVLIPRAKTEELVEKVINFFWQWQKKYQKTSKENFAICDVGTGSGCVAIALAKNLPQVKIYACDISPKALAVAKINAKKHKVSSQIKFLQSNLLRKIPHKIKFNVIVANLPYLSKKEYQTAAPEIKKEPKIALLGGKNGNEIYKKLLKQAPKYLKKEGKIFLEESPHAK